MSAYILLLSPDGEHEVLVRYRPMFVLFLILRFGYTPLRVPDGLKV